MGQKVKGDLEKREILSFGSNLRWLCPQVQHTHKGVYPTVNIYTSVSIAALYIVVNKYIVGTGLPVYEKGTR